MKQHMHKLLAPMVTGASITFAGYMYRESGYTNFSLTVWGVYWCGIVIWFLVIGAFAGGIIGIICNKIFSSQEIPDKYISLISSLLTFVIVSTAVILFFLQIKYFGTVKGWN